jgi:hypothetical protein
MFGTLRTQMDRLYDEAAEYIRYEWKDLASNLKLHHLREAIEPYADYYEALVPSTFPEPLKPYLHRERMLYDKYMSGDLLVFCFDPKDDDELSLYSNNSLDDEELEKNETNFVNGVKVLDEFDFREQISANEFTGGYWDPEIHWVLQKKRLEEIMRRRTPTLTLKKKK